MVVVEHAQQQVVRHGRGDLGFELSIGPAGVDVFFVISGFVMCMMAHGKDVRPLDFWARRIIRIVPLYWLYTTLFLLVYAANSDLLHNFVFDRGHVMASYLFIPFFHPKFPEQIWPALTPGWTLNYEMYFYLLFGCGLFLKRWSRRSLIAYVLIAAMVVGVLFRPTSATLTVFTNPLLAEFLAGIAIGRLFLSDVRTSRSLSIGLIGLSVVLFAIAQGWGPIDNGGNWQRVALWGGPGACLVAGFVCWEKSRPMLQSRLLHAIGDASYSTYLSHYFSLVAAAVVWRKLGLSAHIPDVLFLLALVVASTAVGWMAYVIVEKPLTSLFNQTYRSRVRQALVT